MVVSKGAIFDLDELDMRVLILLRPKLARDMGCEEEDKVQRYPKPTFFNRVFGFWHTGGRNDLRTRIQKYVAEESGRWRLA